MRRALIGIAVVLALGAVGSALYLYTTYKHLSIPRNEIPDFTVETLPFTLPDGFTMSVYAEGIQNARTLAFAPSGSLMVTQPSEGMISVLPDRDGDGKADEARTVIAGLESPHGIAFRCPTEELCELYIAEKSMLLVFDYDAATDTVSNKRELLPLPGGTIGSHITRSLLFLPSPEENRLLISVGSSCNACIEEDARRATVLFYDTDTKAMGTYATGLRNAVFMTLHPVTGVPWVTEMGRDGLGDERPPDEINILTQGGFYGWPWYFGKNERDISIKGDAPLSPRPSHVDLEAHSAPLGLTFIPEEGWPEEQWFDLLVSYHGSWNRSTLTGYKIVRIDLDDKGNYQGTYDFITGWLRPDGTTIGRPADVLALPGGTVYISDDASGIVYKMGRVR